MANDTKETKEKKTAGAEPKKRKKFSEMETRFLTDYYKVNRDSTTADRERWKQEKEERKAKGQSEKATWTRREIRMAIACGVLAVLCILRYFVFKF